MYTCQNIHKMSEPSTKFQDREYRCGLKNGMRIQENDQVVYETKNPLIVAPVMIVGTVTVMGVIVGAGVGAAAPLYGAGKLLHMGGRVVLRNIM